MASIGGAGSPSIGAGLQVPQEATTKASALKAGEESNDNQLKADKAAEVAAQPAKLNPPGIGGIVDTQA